MSRPQPTGTIGSECMSGVSCPEASRGVLLLLIRLWLCSPGRRIVLLRLAGCGRAWRFAAAPLMRPPLMNRCAGDETSRLMRPLRRSEVAQSYGAKSPKAKSK